MRKSILTFSSIEMDLDFQAFMFKIANLWPKFFAIPMLLCKDFSFKKMFRVLKSLKTPREGCR